MNKIHVITTDWKGTNQIDKLESEFYSYCDGTLYTQSKIDYYVTEFEGNEKYDLDTFQTILETDLNKLNIIYKIICYK